MLSRKNGMSKAKKPRKNTVVNYKNTKKNGVRKEKKRKQNTNHDEIFSCALLVLHFFFVVVVVAGIISNQDWNS